MCDDDIVDLAENDRIDMLVPKYNKVANSDETLIETQVGDAHPRARKVIEIPLQMGNQTNKGIMISLLTCPVR